MITKLTPRWIGPYKIYNHDERGNYFLIDALGNGMSQKYPLEKLKVVDESKLKPGVDEIKTISR